MVRGAAAGASIVFGPVAFLAGEGASRAINGYMASQREEAARTAVEKHSDQMDAIEMREPPAFSSTVISSEPTSSPSSSEVPAGGYGAQQRSFESYPDWDMSGGGAAGGGNGGGTATPPPGGGGGGGGIQPPPSEYGPFPNPPGQTPGGQPPIDIGNVPPDPTPDGPISGSPTLPGGIPMVPGGGGGGLVGTPGSPGAGLGSGLGAGSSPAAAGRSRSDASAAEQEHRACPVAVSSADPRAVRLAQVAPAAHDPAVCSDGPVPAPVSERAASAVSARRARVRPTRQRVARVRERAASAPRARAPVVSAERVARPRARPAVVQVRRTDVPAWAPLVVPAPERPGPAAPRVPDRAAWAAWAAPAPAPSARRTRHAVSRVRSPRAWKTTKRSVPGPRTPRPAAATSDPRRPMTLTDKKEDDV